MRTHAAIAPAVLASLLPLCSLVAAGCGGAADEPPALEEYFAAAPYANAACNTVDQRLAGTREVRLFVSGDVDLLSVTQGLARYYHRHGLSFVTSAQPEETTMRYALDTDEASLMKATIAAFPDVDFSDEEAVMADPVLWAQVQAFWIKHFFQPLIDFTTTHAAGQGVTNLVVLPTIESPGGASISEEGTTAGLSISSALLAEFARAMSSDAEFWEQVNLPEGFTPFVILGNEILAQQTGKSAVIKDLVVAHEFGHSAGLPHLKTDKRNLMYPTATPGLNDCTDSLNDAQLDAMAATLDLPTAASGALVAAQARGAAAPPLGRAGVLSSSFTPAHLRALMSGDSRAMRLLVDLLLHREPARN